MPLTLKPLRLPVSRNRAPVDPLRLLIPVIYFSFGFFLQFNVMTSTFGLPFMRLSDALLFLFIAGLFVAVGMRKTVQYGLLYFTLLFAIVGTTLMFKAGVGEGDVYPTLIFFGTSVFAFYFAYLAEDETLLLWFATGTLLGLIPSLAVLFLQASGYGPSLTSIGLGVPIDQSSSLLQEVTKAKPGGIWTAGNEAGHVYSVATASALYLALRLRHPLIFVAAYCFLAASFSVTLNRSGLIAPTIGLIYCYMRIGSISLYAKTIAFLLVAAAFLASSVDMPGLDMLSDTFQARFLEDTHTDQNIAERIVSNLQGVRVAFQFPFGIGYQERISMMALLTINGVISIHNGFLSLAYQSGLLSSFFYIISCVYLFTQRRSISSFYPIMVAFTASSMMFEELSINQFFIFSVSLTIAAAWLHYSKATEVTRQSQLALRPFALRNREK